MALSFAEMRAQTRSLNSISFWLNPQSRAFDTFSRRVTTIEDFEKLCGPIRDTQFDANLANDYLQSALELAEGLLFEYAATLNYFLRELTIPASLVCQLHNGDPGMELDLTLTVLQSIINGNEAISTRAEISEGLEKLVETKTKLESGEIHADKVMSFGERITNYDGITEEEIQQFIDEIERDRTYQEHLTYFEHHAYHLKGFKHVQFLQNVYAHTNTINMSFYDCLFSVMQSVMGRLSEEELKTALTTSTVHFNRVKDKKTDYVRELEQAINCEKSGLVFAARVLILGMDVAMRQLTALLARLQSNERDLSNKDNRRTKGQHHEKDNNMTIKEIATVIQRCGRMLADVPAPLYKILFEADFPVLLVHLFSAKSEFFINYYRIPLRSVILSGAFPLHKLLNTMLKAGEKNKNNFIRLLNCFLIRNCINEVVKPEDMEDTVQALISCTSIAVGPGLSPPDEKGLLSLMRFLMEKSGEEQETWMLKYENHEKVHKWMESLEPKKEPAQSTKESASEEWVTENESEVKEEAEKTKEGVDEVDSKEEGEQKDEEGEKTTEVASETEVKGEEEKIEKEDEEADKKEEEEGGKTAGVGSETEVKKDEDETKEGDDGVEKGEEEEGWKTAEDESEKEEEGTKGDANGEVEKGETAETVVVKEKDDETDQDLQDSALNVTQEEVSADEQEPVDDAVVEEQKDHNDQVVQHLAAGDSAVKEEEAVVEQVPQDAAAAIPAAAVVDDEIYPEEQGDLPFRDHEPFLEEEQNEETEEEEEEGNEALGLGTTQSSATSQVDGIARSLNNIDQIGQ